MTEARSKRRILPLIFIVKSFKKPLLIKENKAMFLCMYVDSITR